MTKRLRALTIDLLLAAGKCHFQLAFEGTPYFISLSVYRGVVKHFPIV